MNIGEVRYVVSIVQHGSGPEVVGLASSQSQGLEIAVSAVLEKLRRYGHNPHNGVGFYFQYVEPDGKVLGGSTGGNFFPSEDGDNEGDSYDFGEHWEESCADCPSDEQLTALKDRILKSAEGWRKQFGEVV